MSDFNSENELDTHIGAYQGDSIYDFDNYLLLNWYPRRILKLIAQRKSLLELGVGHGYSNLIFANNFKRHLIIEGSPAVIKNFREEHPDSNAEIKQDYFETFQTEEKFSTIVMGFVLEHVDDPSTILQKYKNYLSKNGSLFVAVPNAESLNRRIGHEAGLLNNLENLSDYDKLLGHKRYFTVKSLTKLIHEAGYEAETIEGIYLKAITTSQMNLLKLEKKVSDAFCSVGIDYPELSCAILAELKIAK